MLNTAALIAPHPARKISLTALIDVVFILLMFFMLTSSFTQYSMLALDTPTASASASAVQPQLLRLLPDHSVSVSGEHSTTADSLEKAIPALNLVAPIVILPHADINVQTILSTFETLKNNGAVQLTLGAAWGVESV